MNCLQEVDVAKHQQDFYFHESTDHRVTENNHNVCKEVRAICFGELFHNFLKV